MPFISIVIPIYNAKNYIEKCLESVTSQTFSDIEIICVNDKSTDGTAAIIEIYMESDKRIRLIHHERNLGELKSRSTGVMAAKGQYIMFSDADDEFEPNACERLHSVSKQHKADIYGFGVTVVCQDEKNRKRTQEYFKTHSGYMYGFEIMRKSVMREITWNAYDKMYASQPCKKAYAFIGDKLMNLRLGSALGSDAIAFVAVAYFSEKFYGIEDALYRFHYGRGTIMRNDPISLKKFENFCLGSITLESCREFFALHGEFEKYEEIIKIFGERLFLSCAHEWLTRVSIQEKEEALQMMIRYWPHSYMVAWLGSFAATAHMKKWETPFKLLPLGGRIVLYGAGGLGQDYYRQITDSKACEIVLWADKNYLDLQKAGLPVSSPDEIDSVEYDGILVAVLDKDSATRIKEFLMKSLNVPEKLIIWQSGVA